jgi:hypothetical protein
MGLQPFDVGDFSRAIWRKKIKISQQVFYRNNLSLFNLIIFLLLTYHFSTKLCQYQKYLCPHRRHANRPRYFTILIKISNSNSVKAIHKDLVYIEKMHLIYLNTMLKYSLNYSQLLVLNWI